MIATAAGGVASFVRPITANLQLEEVLKNDLSEWAGHKDYGVATYAISPSSPYTVMLETLLISPCISLSLLTEGSSGIDMES